MNDLDIWRSAGTLIGRYGTPDALLLAARRADALLEQGDAEGFLVWKRIVRAIEELNRTSRAAMEQLH